MDNDGALKRALAGIARKVRFKVQYAGMDVLAAEQGNALIAERIASGGPFMACRAGATEMRCVGEYLRRGAFSERISGEIGTLSGVFPSDAGTLRRFCELYMECMSQADLLALWGVGAEARVVRRRCGGSRLTRMAALEPYYFQDPWSAALEGRKVLVVHPFAGTIERQWAKRRELWPGRKVLPEAKALICLEAVQSIAGRRTGFATWFDALRHMEAQIGDADFDVAVIGAGAYGVPLAACVRRLGKQAVHMGGAAQILFGIKGRRWDAHPVISKFYNAFWTRPGPEETPAGFEKVEGGSYW